MIVSFQVISSRLGRRIFLAILAIFAVGCLKAEGVYQTTKNKRTLVWNSAPKPGDTATWVGDRNRERYASGFGTLTWYTANGKIFARYYGNMVDGKFDGPVNAHSNGRVAHATFAEGKRISPWTGGAATLRGGFAERKSTPAPQREVEKPEKRDVVPEAKPESREIAAETPKKEAPPPPPPKPEPKPTATPEIKRAAAKPAPPLPAPSERPSPEHFPTPAAAPTAKRGVDESLQSLVGPPSSLRNAQPAEKNPNGPLTRQEALDLANTVARTHGYDPANYADPKVEHNESDETWSLSYDKTENDGGTGGKHLSITVDGKTKRASIAPPEEHKDSP